MQFSGKTKILGTGLLSPTFLGMERSHPLQVDGDVQYRAMLRPVIQDQIHRDIQSYSNRNTNINWQALYAAEQNRLMSIHILRFITDLVDASEELVPIITACHENALDNIEKMFSDLPVALQRKETNREWQS